MHRLLGGVALAVTLVVGRDAGAYSACNNGEGWALAPGTTVTAHPHLAYFIDARGRSGALPGVKATVDGKPVKATVTAVKVVAYTLAVIDISGDIATDHGGKLELTWQPDPKGPWHFRSPTAAYTIDPKLKLGKEAKGTATRFHKAFHHSTVHELEDGLAVAVDQPAIAFTAKWRLDDKAPWATVELTAVTVGGHPTARLGELGCTSSFQTAVLERGIDLELTAKLVDGSTVKVTGLPAHYTLPKLPADAEVSEP